MNHESLVTNRRSRTTNVLSKVKRPARTMWSAGLVMSGSCRDRHAIDQVTHAVALHMQMYAQARGPGRIRPKIGEEPENIRKIIP